jgi:flagellar biosynthesis protein FlhB
MNLINKIKTISIIIISIFIIVPNIVFSQNTINTENLNPQTDMFKQGSGYTEVSGAEGISDIVARIIFTGLSLLAVVFVVLIIIAGFQWMTAGGNEEQIANAKKNISNAVIGLIIILSAYSITWFIFTYLPMSAGTGGGGGNPTGGSGD